MTHRMPGVAVAVPVNNEVELIGPCLLSLDAAACGHGVDVLLLLNNCTDDTAAVVRGMSPGLSCRVHVVEQDFPPGLANAGQARRLAMVYAAALAGPDGVLMTTDADSRVAEDWIAANLRALATGADAVAGRIEIDPREALLIPAALHDDDARECAYDALLDEIAWLLDPDPADPWPRHTRESGASIAVTVSAWHSAGGIPAMASGEDRAFFAALRAIDARIRHAPEPVVTVSARLWGRARGGMAETIRRRMVAPDPFIDDRLEPVADAVRRATLRHGLRRYFLGAPAPSLSVLAAALGLPEQVLRSALDGSVFGAGWSMVEAASPVLVRRRVAAADLAEQTRQALGMRGRLLASAAPADRGGSPVLADAATD